MNPNLFFTIAFQITQDCIYGCEICNRRFIKGETRLTKDQRFQMIEQLNLIGLKRLTITGGEPMLMEAEVLDLLEFTHSKKIHTCLSTTGHGITREVLLKMDKYLDQLLISIPTLRRDEWIDFFKSKKNSDKLYDNVIEILKTISETGIILEVCTVITSENKNKIFALGEELLKINNNIIWKLEYYYPMGIYSDKREKFEMERAELANIRSELKTSFAGKFLDLYITEPIRHTAPNIFITPSGHMVRTSDHNYSESIGDILYDYHNVNFQMNRPWSEYIKYCREWNW